MLKSRLGTTGTAVALMAGLAIYAIPGAVAGVTKPSKPVLGPVSSRTTPLPVGGVPIASPPTRQPLTATVTLPTGDKVKLDGATQNATVVSPANGVKVAAATFTQFSWHGDRYVIPAAAAPYLSTVLDPRLFDVSYLVRAHLDDAHSSTLPLKITYSGATTALSGVHVTSTSGKTAAATVSKAQSGQLSKQLATQWRAAYTGSSSAPVGTLPGIAHIELAPPAGAPQLPVAPSRFAARPQAGGSAVPFRTLTLKAIDLNGKPGTVVGFAQDLDDPSVPPIWITYLSGQQGTVRLSVPQGTYSLAFSVMTGPADDFTVKSALVMKPQVTIDSDQLITMDARTAKPYHVALNPAGTSPAFQQDIMGFTRTNPTGGGTQIQGYGQDGFILLTELHLFSTTDFGSPGLYATPTSPVTKGSFNFNIFTELMPSETAASPDPRYYLTFPHQGTIPSSMSYTVNRSALSAGHQEMYNSPCKACSGEIDLSYMSYLPWAQNEMAVDPAVPLGDRTDYLYSSAPKLTTWQASVYYASDGYARWDGRRSLSPGQQFTEEWNKAPLAPSSAATYVQVPTLGFGDADGVVTDPQLAVCPACRQDDNALLYVQPIGDSDPSHYADDDWIGTSTTDFYRNGVLAVSGAVNTLSRLAPKLLELPMLPKAAGYRLDWTESNAGDSAIRTDTNWTFRSAPGDKAAVLGAGEKCAPDVGRSCSFLPLLFVRYDLALNDQSQAKAGAPFAVDFAVTHQQYQPAPAGAAATVSVSYDDGKTWSGAQTAKSLGGGRFSLAITHPSLASTTGFVSLRVTAHDSSGNAVTQTIIRAYALTN